MRKGRWIGFFTVVAGIAILAVCLLADPLGIGNSNTFGWKQIVGSLAGLVLAGLGGALLYRK
jgi:hypothetical protein